MKSINLTSFRDHLDQEHGKPGKITRTEYEEKNIYPELKIMHQTLDCQPL
jgi:hypothetical protein